MPPPQLIGPYHVVRELGRGGMGVVYEVSHPGLPGRRLALKTLLTASLDPGDVFRFQREAHLLAQLDHPNVVRVHQLGQQGESLFVVLDFVAGPTFDTLLREGPLPPQRAARLLIQLAEGVQALHDAGIVHRDLKPQNVVLRTDGTPVLLDFGLAREVDGQSLTQTGAVLGTPQFMSPEQARGDEQRKLPAVDVYGLGAVLYACLSGRPPFDGPSMVSILFDLSSSSPDPLVDVPRPIAEVCFKALSKEPHARYASPQHFAHALREALQAKPARGRSLLPLVAGALVVALGLALAIRWAGDREVPAEPVASAPAAEDVDDDVPWWTLEVEDPRRWVGFQEIRGEIDAPEHEAVRAHLAAHPLLRFREPNAVDVPEGTDLLCDAHWLDDTRCLTFTPFPVGPHRVAVLDLADPREPLHEITPAPYGPPRLRYLRELAWSPDRARFGFLSASGAVFVVDAQTLTTPPSFPQRPPPEPANSDQLVAVWTPPADLRALIDGGFKALAFGPDHRFAVGGDFDSIWWGTLEPEDVRALPGQELKVQQLAFVSDGRLLAAFGSHKGANRNLRGSLTVFEVDGGGEEVGSSEFMECVCVFEDPLEVVTGTGLGYLQHYDAELRQDRPFAHEKFEFEHKAHDTAVGALARLDRRLLSACNPEEFDGADVGVHVWDLDRRTLESVLPVGGGVFTLDVSPDGELLLVGLRSGYVEVWLCPRS